MTTRVALAGAGVMASIHGYALAHVTDAAITHVASRDPERARVAADRLGATATSYDELPSGADVLVVATPPALHVEHALAGVRAGAAVLVEKPLATTLAGADRLVAAARDGARIAYGENLLHAPAVAAAHLQARQLGRPTHLEVRARQGRPSWGDFLSPAWGGGVLFDLGVHPLAVALVLAAPATPAAVRARLDAADDHPVDEHAELDVRFDDDAVARVVASWRSEDAPDWDAQFASPQGTMRLELLPAARVERDGTEVAVPPPPAGVPNEVEDLGYRRQLLDVVGAARNGAEPLVGAAFGRAVLDVVCGAYASAGRDGAWVDLPYSGDRDATPLELWKG